MPPARLACGFPGEVTHPNPWAMLKEAHDAHRLHGRWAFAFWPTLAASVRGALGLEMAAHTLSLLAQCRADLALYRRLLAESLGGVGVRYERLDANGPTDVTATRRLEMMGRVAALEAAIAEAEADAS